MISKLFYTLALATLLVSCQFTETMVLNEDGSGQMKVSVDLKEMLGMASMGDSAMVAVDTIVRVKDYLIAKKDSISKLSAKEQADLKKLENYVVHMQMDPEKNIWNMETYVDFKNINEANDLMSGFEKATSALPNSTGSSLKMGDDDKKEEDAIGTTYSFENGIFKRDAFIKDRAAYKKQVDSLKSAEMMMGSITYKLKYTFPKKIKKSSLSDATYSLDRKTMTVEKAFLDYMKNPDILDVEVELEK